MAKKNIIIKIWPELIYYIPATIPYSSINSKSNIGKNILLDFNNCKEVNSSGLNILLIQILKLMQNKSYNRPWLANPDITSSVIQKIVKLGFFNKLNTYSNISDIFWDQSLNQISNEPVIEYLNPSERIKSFPLLSQEINKNYPNNRRKYLSFIRAWIYKNFFNYSEKYDLNIINLINVLTEIVKNTADHTNSDAFMGIDVIENVNNEYIKIYFSIGDLGEGINNHIKYAFSLENPISKRPRHWDLTNTYMWAFTSGNTTKIDSKENKGIGMSSIITSSKGVPLELSIFDANSRGIISNLIANSYTHKTTRAQFYSIDKPVGFYYFGEIHAKNNNYEKN
jgi:hypothetical protein